MILNGKKALAFLIHFLLNREKREEKRRQMTKK
jgi:hypothetical protein